MKQEYSFTECYKILSASSTQSFNEIRKAYKRKIQKFHPDKLDDTQKEVASNKIKELNTAFSQIEKHYKTHNSLPAIESTEEPKERNESKKQQHKHESVFNNFDSTNKSTYRGASSPKDKSHKSRIAFVIIICIASFVIFYFENFYSNIQPAVSNEPDKTEKNSPIPTPIKSEKQADKTITSTRIKIPDFFTIGSPIGEVIDVQGKPDKTNENTWHYGKSKVFFQDGYVIDWKREKGHPIKARLIIDEDSEFIKPDTNIKKKLPGTLPKQNNLNSLK